MKLKIKDILLNYKVFGEGKPIVIVHGYSVDYRVMFKSMENLFTKESCYKRIYVDLPGMGESTSADWIKSSDDMLDILVEFINKVTSGEKFLLAGESYGGYLVRGVLYKIPKKVSGLLLVCPAIIADFKKRTVPEHTVLVKDNELKSKISEEAYDDFNSISVVQNENIYKRYDEEIMSGVKLGDEKFLRRLQETGYSFSFNVDNLSEKFYGPTLMLLGRQDSVVGYKDAWSILENFPRATFAVIDMAGHNLQIEQEKIFNTLVTDWIKRVHIEN
ncbi:MULTISPECIES: alpha/beta fold hydrolase [Clostridium]|uniref:alpha/beta fold hydrolase n=1 Tax=Clostridium TaxID=1485 RepID=UPI0008245353|nr:MULTISPECIES: alpha/beta hydrolase [Clostridium]PJI09081.1 alpha/beta hydrolase [Clostridium sp. CT7]